MNDAPPPPEAAPASIDLVYLEPETITLTARGSALDLAISDKGEWTSIQVFRIFPLSEPDRYVSLRDSEGKELGVVVDPARIAVASRDLLLAALDRRYFLPRIHEIIDLRDRFGTLDWHVRTDRGEARFTTRHLRDNIAMPMPSRYLVTDVEGNRFDIPDFQGLPPASQAKLSRFL